MKKGRRKGRRGRKRKRRIGKVEGKEGGGGSGAFLKREEGGRTEEGTGKQGRGE
jgi:hypothetical protein